MIISIFFAFYGQIMMRIHSSLIPSEKETADSTINSLNMLANNYTV